MRDEEPERKRFSFDHILWKAKEAWHGVKLGQSDWSGSSHRLAFSVEAPKEKLAFHVILNACWEPLEFELPQAGDRSQDSWHR